MLLFNGFSDSSPLFMGASSYVIYSVFGFLLLGLLAGGSPAATYFSLLRQRKVSKRKATRLSGSLRFAWGNLRCPEKTGVGENSLHCVALKQRAALIPFLPGITGPDRTAQSGIKIEQPNSHEAQAQVSASVINATISIAACAIAACAKGTFHTQTPALEPESVPASPVLAGPGGGGKKGGRGGKSGIRAARCLSRRRVCADPRFCRSSQVARSAAQGPGQPGRLFFGDFLLAKQKKVTSRRATPGQQLSTKKTKTRTRTGTRQ
jgi:hypothetical protein